MTEHPTITTICPSCAQSFEVDASVVGRKGRCENCQAKFIIEEAQLRPNRGPAAAKGSAASSKRLPAAAWLLLLVAAAGGVWVFSQQQKSERRDAVEKTTPAKSSAGPREPEEAARPPEAGGDARVVEGTRIAGGPETATPAAAGKGFPIQTEFANIDIREYQRTYPRVYQGWMPNGAGDVNSAREWGSYLGPLGVRVRSHVPQLQGRPAFAAIVPEVIRDASGDLGINAAEVVSIAPGSAAEGHLQVGDLVIGIEGEPLKSGNQYKPDWKFMHKDARELQLMLGEKIDQAQARGDIRLTVLRFPKGATTRLPVTRKELWSGQGGNQATGVQTFDVEIPGEGYVTLVSDQFDGVIHGDGTAWMDIAVEGDYGTKKLFELTPESASAGYGRPVFELEKPLTHRGRTFAQSLRLHAHGSAKWRLPKGTKRIKGNFAALSYGKVQPKVYFTNLAFPLTGVHKEHVVELRFPIGKTGSFSATYPRNCEKSDLMARRHTAWLAAQQRENGSWPRLAGYTRDGWDTAWCALALMSGGDKQYDAQVRKAAYYLAYDNAPSEWTAERAMRLICLSEYYLRTKDKKIIAGIQAAYYQLLDCCKADYMAGHKVNGFGYGIAGQHYGTGHLALAIALASRTPISTNEALVSSIIRHAGEVCVNGTYAYGRGRRMARDASRKHSGGNAMSGPGMLGAQIGGGHSSSIKELAERMQASIGDGDNSHATSSLAFVFSSLALAAADEEAFLRHMRNFRYKLTLDDNWEGGFLKSAFALDLQTGEGVTSNWIRSAGSILVLNALKRQLAITGAKQHWKKERIPEVAVSEWGGQVHSYYLRNWCIAQELLGRRAPRELAIGIKEMHRLPRTLELVPKTREVVLKFAPAMVRKINRTAGLSPVQKAHAIELLCGLDFKIHDTRKDGRQNVTVEITQPLHQLNWRDKNKEEMFRNSPWPLKTKVEIKSGDLLDPMQIETEGTEKFNLDQGTRKFNLSSAIRKGAPEQIEGTARIAFRLGGTTVSYRRPLVFNKPFSHSNNYNLRRFQLRLKLAPRAYFQSQPLVIAGIAFDAMYPAERMLELHGPANGVAVNAHEGDEVLVDIASENFICAWLHSLKFAKPTQVAIHKPRQHTSVRGSIEGNTDHLYDFSRGTHCTLTGAERVNIIEYDFFRAVKLNGLDADYGGAQFIRVWYKKGDAWVPLVWDNYSVGTSHHPVFPETSARLWRVEIHHGGKLRVNTLRFYHNANVMIKHGTHPQSEDASFLPPIQPN